MQGIMFIEELTVATAEGRKTRTSRVIDPQPDKYGLSHDFPELTGKPMTFWGTAAVSGEIREFKPRYKVGEVLYIKEPWADWFGERIIYKYGASDAETDYRNFHNVKWDNKQGMPARFARTFVKIIDVRARRLQDILDIDCLKEGITKMLIGCEYHKYSFLKDGEWQDYNTPRESFAALWDSLAKPGQKWEDNPWVWVYDYELTTKPE